MSKQERRSGKSGWMAHWMRTSSNATADRLDESACHKGVSGAKDPEKYAESLGLISFGKEGMCSCGIAGTSLELVRTHFSSHDRCKFDKGKDVSRPSIFFKNQMPDARIGQEEHGQKLESETGNQSELDTCINARFGVDWLQKMQKCSHFLSLLPSQSSAKKVHKVHETMRICTTAPRGIPWFSQTTHSLLIAKKTDAIANVSKETDIFRRLVTQMSGSSSSVPPFFGQANRGVTLQPISEGQGNASTNESSAETDTMDMDMDLSEERLNCGANSARSTKVFNLDNNPSPRNRMSSGLPEINLELPALPAVASSSEDIPTSSRTQSLEMDIHLKSKRSLDKADPSTRWVKRLKLSSSETSKSSKLSHDKKRDFFRSILKKGIITREQHGKDEHLPPADQPKKSKELLLSHVWIKRWLRNGSQISQRKQDALVVCEQRSSKSPLDDLPKKFPSIAAMALMGRTMSGFQSCELQRRGSFTIWNTNTL